MAFFAGEVGAVFGGLALVVALVEGEGEVALRQRPAQRVDAFGVLRGFGDEAGVFIRTSSKTDTGMSSSSSPLMIMAEPQPWQSWRQISLVVSSGS